MKGIACKYEFDSEAIREIIQEIFTDGEIEVIVKPYSINARLYNGNSFHISIHNSRNCIYANCRRKYTSLKPDWEKDFNLDCYLEEIFQVISLHLIQLNDKILR